MQSKRWIKLGLIAAAAGAAWPLCVFAQATAPATAPASMPATMAAATAPAPAPLWEPTPVATAPARPAAPAVDANPGQSLFVGVINADRVNVRTGPSQTYYEVGQLNKGDLVNVVADHTGWYEITPPAGTFAYIAKDLVDANAGATSGTIKGDTVNVRGGSALFPSSDYAVIGKVKKGSTVAIVGVTDKYYKVAPPPGAVLYVIATYITKSPANTAYTAPTIAMPGAHLPDRPATGPAIAVRPGIAVEEPGTTTQIASTQTASTHPADAVIPTPVDNEAINKFNDLNNRTQAELQKPVLERNLEGLLKEYEDLAVWANVPASVKQGSAARIDLLKTQIKVQELSKDASTANGSAIDEQRKALQKQWDEAKKRVDEMEKNSPPIAEGTLKTSTTIASKYVLVNPATGRVVAYVDPSSEIDLSRLLGQYIGVRGTYTQDAALGIRVISAKTATLMAAPTNP